MDVKELRVDVMSWIESTKEKTIVKLTLQAP